MAQAIPGTSYRHYRTGDVYTVIGIGKHTETDEPLVAYRLSSNPGSQIWLRPLSMFEADVEWEGERVPRFSPVA